MYSEEDYIQLSAIQHYVFCPRQCALIYVEGIWAENLFTARGEILHKRVDSEEDEMRGNKYITRGLNVYSKRLGLSGRADVVEFTDTGEKVVPYPVEYKSGKPKFDISDSAQLCAQALCLEEMLGVSIGKAAIFYGKPRKRLEVELTQELRKSTEDIIVKIHEMVQIRFVPKASYNPKCEFCSIVDECMPKVRSRKLSKYIKELSSPYEETS